MILKVVKKSYVILLLFMSLIVFGSYAQDTIRVFQYNLLRYGETNQTPATKNPLLQTIIAHTNPTIFGANELSGSADYAPSILNGVLNINGITKWKRATYTKAGTDKSLVNTIFYDSEKFELKKQETVSTVQREITAYYLYYKDENLPITQDTIFFTVIVAHLKAGNESASAAIRSNETQQVVNYLNNLNRPANIIFMGDFNVYTSNEAAYQNLINNSNVFGKLYDPLNRPGSWNNSSAFADIHTQSSRGGSYGGLDDRFDILLCNKYVLNDSLRVRILPNTYKAVGNDGLHFNVAINDAPTNNSVPGTVLNALYNMSDHLPIMADFVITPSEVNTGLKSEVESLNKMISVQNPFKNELVLNCSARLNGEVLNLVLYSSQGQQILQHKIFVQDSENQYNIPLHKSLKNGFYILKITNSNGVVIVKKILKS